MSDNNSSTIENVMSGLKTNIYIHQFLKCCLYIFFTTENKFIDYNNSRHEKNVPIFFITSNTPYIPNFLFNFIVSQSIKK